MSKIENILLRPSGLAEIADSNPTWERTPLFHWIFGKPAYRSFRYVTGEWVYSDTNPVTKAIGIDKSPNRHWRNHYSGH